MSSYFYLFLIFGVPAIALAILGCRRRIARGHQPTLWQAILPSFLAPPVIFLGWLIVMGDGRSVFTAAFWDGGGKPGGLEILLPLVGFLVIFALILTSILVFLYQRKAKRLGIK